MSAEWLTSDLKLWCKAAVRNLIDVELKELRHRSRSIGAGLFLLCKLMVRKQLTKVMECRDFTLYDVVWRCGRAQSYF
jgi:hypothetical protein